MLWTAVTGCLAGARLSLEHPFERQEVEAVAVDDLVDEPLALLLAAVAAVRDVPAPLGQVPTRLAALAHASVELRGIYLRDLARAEQDGEPAAAGCRSAADLLVEHAGIGVSRARADAGQARRLAGLPGLLEAVAAGDVPVAAARLLARAWAALPEQLRDTATAAALLELGRLLDQADLQAKVDELLGALQPEVTDDALAAAHDAGELDLVDVGAQTRLRAHTDAVTGEWLREVLDAVAEKDRGLTDSRTAGRRRLDALLACVRAASGTSTVPQGDAAPLLVVVATVADLLRTCDATPEVPAPADALADLFSGLPGRDDPSPAGVPAADGTCSCAAAPPPDRWSARTRGAVSVGPRTLALLSCSARLTRMVVSPLGHPLDSSPAARQLSRRERRALEQRAGYRCQRAGCGRPARRCVPHHVRPWALGGASTLENTVLLCEACHHALHDACKTLELTDGSRIGPRGWVRPPPDRPPEPLFG